MNAFYKFSRNNDQEYLFVEKPCQRLKYKIYILEISNNKWVSATDLMIWNTNFEPQQNKIV